MQRGSTQLCVLENLLEPGLRTISYELFSAWQMQPSTIYLTIDELADDEATERALMKVVQSAVARMIRRYCNRVIAQAGKLFPGVLHGIEVWTTLSTCQDDKVLIHVDNDERVRERLGLIRYPLFGSILYLGPSSGLKGGGTFFVLSDTSSFDAHAILFKPTSWSSLELRLRHEGLFIPFRPGRVVLFDGQIPHCITPFSTDQANAPRVTLLVNGWSKRIETA